MECTKKAHYSHESGYAKGCRCDLCKAAKAASGKAAYNSPKGIYRKDSPERKASNQAYWKSPRGKAVRGVWNTKRRTKMRKSFGDLTAHEQKLMYMIHKLRPVGYEVDHIHPISKDGLDSPMNLQYLSISDNRRKSAKLDYVPQDRVIQWYELIDPLTGEPRV